MLQPRSRKSLNNSFKTGRRLIVSYQNLLPLFKKLIFIIPLLVLFLLISKLFTVKEIACHTDYGVCSDDVNNLLGHLKGKSVFFINQKNLIWSIKQLYPIENLNYQFVFPNKIKVTIKGWEPTIPLYSIQASHYPVLSFDIFQNSTSSSWINPTKEIKEFISTQEGVVQDLWLKGRLTPAASNSASIKFIYVENQLEETLTNSFQLIKLIQKYLPNPEIYILGRRFFLSQLGLPDIIIYVPADLTRIESALQSLDYLVTIKKEARVIDLSFKHPIIK